MVSQIPSNVVESIDFATSLFEGVCHFNIFPFHIQYDEVQSTKQVSQITQYVDLVMCVSVIALIISSVVRSMNAMLVIAEPFLCMITEAAVRKKINVVSNYHQTQFTFSLPCLCQPS